MRSPCCVSVNPPPPPSNNFWPTEPICMKLGMYIMTHELVSTANFINPSQQSVSVWVSLLSLLGKGSVKCIPFFFAWQRFGTHVPVATNTRNSRRIVEWVCLWVCLCILLSLLGNNLVKDFPAATKNFWRRRFQCGPCHIKGSRRLILPRTSGSYFLPQDILADNWHF
jgi:hypothetical protein